MGLQLDAPNRFIVPCPVAPDYHLTPHNRLIQDLQIITRTSRKMNLWKRALQEHHRRNSHHPEHFLNPSEMDELSKKHMLVDMLADQLAGQWKQDNKWTIPQAAHACQRLPHWQYVKELYTAPIDPSPVVTHERWPKQLGFEQDKFVFLAWLGCFLKKQIPLDKFITGLYGLSCVRYYMYDLQFNQFAAKVVGDILFPNDTELKAALANHDADKWDALMVAAYVLKKMYNFEKVDPHNFLDIPSVWTFSVFMLKQGNIQKEMAEKQKREKLGTVREPWHPLGYNKDSV